MLDQNTDRMWYVIGAVLIGAAIIFGMNTLMPNAFASVSDNMIGVVEDLETRILNATRTEPTPFNTNLINPSDLHVGTLNQHYDSSEYNYTIHDDGQIDVSMVTSGRYDGLLFYAHKLKLEPSMKYVFKFSFESLDDNLVVMGGHTEPNFDNNTVYINGVEQENTWMDATTFDFGQDRYDVEVHFETPDRLINRSEATDFHISRFWIQPNRAMGGLNHIQLYDLSFMKVNRF